MKQMSEKMNVLDVQIDNCMAKDALKLITEYMQTDGLNTVEIVTVDTLMRASQIQGMKEQLERMDLLLPGDMAILETADIADKKRQQEMENRTLMRMVFHYFHKNHKRIFILSGSEEEGNRFLQYLHERYSGIEVVGVKAVPTDESEDDKIINQINGAEADCVIASMEFPGREQFIWRCRQQLYTRLWFGFGPDISFLPEEGSLVSQLKTFIGKKILKREIKKEQKRKES